MAKRKLKLRELFTGRRVFIVRYGVIVPATVLQKASWVTRKRENMYHSLIDFGPVVLRDSRLNQMGRSFSECERRHRTIIYYTREQMATLLERNGVVVHVGEDDSGIEENIFSTREAAQCWINKSPRLRGKKIQLMGDFTPTLIESTIFVGEPDDKFYPISPIDYIPVTMSGESGTVVFEDIEFRDDYQEDKYGLIDILNGDKLMPSISDSLRKLGIKKD